MGLLVEGQWRDGWYDTASTRGPLRAMPLLRAAVSGGCRRERDFCRRRQAPQKHLLGPDDALRIAGGNGIFAAGDRRPKRA
jgi:hypothetical protein